MASPCTEVTVVVLHLLCMNKVSLPSHSAWFLSVASPVLSLHVHSSLSFGFCLGVLVAANMP